MAALIIQRNAGDGAGLFGSDWFGSGSPQAAAGAGDGSLTGFSAVDNVLGALIGRSPGERTVGVSGKGKGPARPYRYARSPVGQALRDTFNSPVGASRVIDDRPSPAAGPGIFLPDTAAAPGRPGLLLPTFPEGGGITGPGGGFFVPPGGFSIGGGGGVPPEVPPVVPPIVPPVVPPINPPPPVAPIPEPATWLTMLLGMTAIGLFLRSGKAARTGRIASSFE
ncbi:PEP-CTERM sorting domain-containing protein [Porphyrobacter sp. GA68]|uniref:PEP-CTERM sorting domain-containing protein n=1 Tax=Porphyrobacter sp. GA68 TaxID=2883480 RepID=UPI001D193B25|nr:PEP-CTERM sorting domain-containing protein [Porphyrobacter sp. GA68]